MWPGWENVTILHNDPKKVIGEEGDNNIPVSILLKTTSWKRAAFVTHSVPKETYGSQIVFDNTMSTWIRFSETFVPVPFPPIYKFKVETICQGAISQPNVTFVNCLNCVYKLQSRHSALVASLCFPEQALKVRWSTLKTFKSMGLVTLKVRRSTGLPAFDNCLWKQCILKTICCWNRENISKIRNG